MMVMFDTKTIIHIRTFVSDVSTLGDQIYYSLRKLIDHDSRLFNTQLTIHSLIVKLSKRKWDIFALKVNQLCTVFPINSQMLIYNR